MNVIYVFGGLMSVGIVIFAHRPWWLLIWVPLIPLQVFRVRKEESRSWKRSSATPIATTSDGHGFRPFACVSERQVRQVRSASCAIHDRVDFKRVGSNAVESSAIALQGGAVLGVVISGR